MPGRPAKPCTHPGCAALVRDGTSRCPRHPKPQWNSETKVARRTGRWLQRERAALFERSPLCAECERAGRIRLATIRDHIVPLAEGGTDDPSNIQGLCDSCDKAKSQAEAQRGRARAA